MNPNISNEGVLTPRSGWILRHDKCLLCAPASPAGCELLIESGEAFGFLLQVRPEQIELYFASMDESGTVGDRVCCRRF